MEATTIKSKSEPGWGWVCDCQAKAGGERTHHSHAQHGASYHARVTGHEMPLVVPV